MLSLPPLATRRPPARFAGAWLDGGTVSVFSGGSEFAANSSDLVPTGPAVSGSGVDGFLGAFAFFAVPWQASTVPPLSILANFTCYAGGAGGSVVVFELTFPGGLPNASIAPPPAQGNYEAGGNALPSTRFPSFAAGPLAAVRNPALRYVEYAGVMSSSVRGESIACWGAPPFLQCRTAAHALPGALAPPGEQRRRWPERLPRRATLRAPRPPQLERLRRRHGAAPGPRARARGSLLSRDPRRRAVAARRGACGALWSGAGERGVRPVRCGTQHLLLLPLCSLCSDPR